MSVTSYFLLSLLIVHGTAQNWGNDCRYVLNSYPHSYLLDLCHYPTNGIVIEAVNSKYRYLYSPSNRSFYSSQDRSHYGVLRIDLNDPSNITYLVEYPSTEPHTVKSQSQLTFEFEYTVSNPLCPDGQETTNIYWQCNNSITNYPHYYEVVSSGSLYPCSNTIFIQSPLACQENQPPILNYDCVFTKNINNQIYTLNLSQYDTIQTPTASFVYYPCFNYQPGWSDTNFHMAWSGSYPTLTWAIWEIDDITEPEYDAEANIWTFTYYGGNNDCSAYETTITFNCSCDYQEAYYAQIEYPEQCNAVFKVSAHDVCIEGECGDCVYYADNWRSREIVTAVPMLNLNELRGVALSGIDDGGLTGFVYTPCNNTMICYDVQTMAVIKDINDDTCVAYLAISDGSNGFKVDYEENDWLISYSNGQECEGDNIQFNVNWKCQTNTEWRVANESFIDGCVYGVTIYSKYACS